MRVYAATCALLFASAAVLPNCKNEEECTKARLATASAWESIRNEAGHFKFQGATGYDEFSPSQKATHLEVFKTMEAQAGLVFESFAFDKISWDTATKGRDRVQQTFNGYFAKDSYAGFKGLLDNGVKRFNEAERACR